MLALLLLVGFSGLKAQRIMPTLSPQPSDCCFPMLWQADIGTLGSRDEFGKFVFNQFTESGTTYYDGFRQLRVTKLRDAATGTKLTTWQDYNKMKEYRLTETDGCQECRIVKLTRPFPRCLPDNVTSYEGTHTMGYGSATTTIQSWTILRNNTAFKLLTSREQDGSCYPLTNTLFIEGPANYDRSRWYTRFKTAILLTSVFRVGDVCQRLERILDQGDEPPRKRCVIPSNFLLG